LRTVELDLRRAAAELNIRDAAMSAHVEYACIVFF
jgi:hypothetical protein